MSPSLCIVQIIARRLEFFDELQPSQKPLMTSARNSGREIAVSLAQSTPREFCASTRVLFCALCYESHRLGKASDPELKNKCRQFFSALVAEVAGGDSFSLPHGAFEVRDCKFGRPTAPRRYSTDLFFEPGEGEVPVAISLLRAFHT